MSRTTWDALRHPESCTCCSCSRLRWDFFLCCPVCSSIYHTREEALTDKCDRASAWAMEARAEQHRADCARRDAAWNAQRRAERAAAHAQAEWEKDPWRQ